MPLFKQHSVSQHADSIASYLPSGELFKSARIEDANFRKLLIGLSQELFTAEGYLKTIENEYDIRTTTSFIEEWEKALGIPDDCFDTTGTLNDRRGNVLLKLIARGTQTVEDFAEIGATIGMNLEISSGVDHIRFPLTFPIWFFNNNKSSRFTIVIRNLSAVGSVFPLMLPFILGGEAEARINCFLNKLKPANTRIVFRS